MKNLDLTATLCHADISPRENCKLLGPIRAHVEIGNGDAGTLGSTVPWMQRLVREGRQDPSVRRKAAALAYERPGQHPVEALFRYAQSLPYVYDETLLAEAGVTNTSELLFGAPHQLAVASSLGEGAARGDCDDRAILLQSMAESLGYPTRFALVKGPGRDDYSHVYSEVRLEDGKWLPFDAIFNGEGGRKLFAPGEEVGPADGARSKMTVPVDGAVTSWWPVLILAALVLWRRT